MWRDDRERRSAVGGQVKEGGRGGCVRKGGCHQVHYQQAPRVTVADGNGGGSGRYHECTELAHQQTSRLAYALAVLPPPAADYLQTIQTRVSAPSGRIVDGLLDTLADPHNSMDDQPALPRASTIDAHLLVTSVSAAATTCSTRRTAAVAAALRPSPRSPALGTLRVGGASLPRPPLPRPSWRPHRPGDTA